MDFLPFARPLIDEATISQVADVLRSGWLTGGPKVVEFETALSVHCGGRTVRTFNSGTAALFAALRLAGIREGDIVITTPLTWPATANVIVEIGAIPRFVDVERTSRNIDLSKVEAAIGDGVRAIMPVDLAGLPVDRDHLYRIAGRHDLRVIEDAAQSFGSRWSGNAIGTIGDFVAFSFQANKNITTGEGGALVLPPDVDARACERLRLQGVVRLPDGGLELESPGMKANLSDVAAAIGLGQLAQAEVFREHRRMLAQAYFQRLPKDRGLELPPMAFDCGNWHMFQVLLPVGMERSEFISAMRAKGIGIGVHYPAIHLLGFYRRMGYGYGDFPVAEDIATRIVTLPLHASMTLFDIDRVCVSIEPLLP